MELKDFTDDYRDKDIEGQNKIDSNFNFGAKNKREIVIKSNILDQCD